LPHELIAAFRATLEETLSASLVVHVIDASDPERSSQQAVVDEVLEEIGAGELPSLKVYNKVDLTGQGAGIERDGHGQVEAVWLSAATGEGLDGLRAAIVERVGEGRIQREIHLPAEVQKLRSRLFDLGVVRSESVEEDGSVRLAVDLARRDVRSLTRLDGLDGKMARDLLLH